ncbi:MAG: KEOPS complex subunit Pcc1 [Candidatus Bathyarchaeia archaeon]
MEADAEITLVYDSAEEALAISNGVSPDNITCPARLTVNTRSLDKKIITIMRYHGENLASFLSTIDDFLNCIATAEKAIGAVKGKSI